MPVRFTVKFDGVAQARAAFRHLPRDAARELEEAKRDLSRTMARFIAAAARSSDRQSAAVAGTVRVRPGSVPAVLAGGSTPVTSQSRRSRGQDPTTADDLLYGANFGAHRLRQFRRYRNAPDYWFFSTIDRHRDTIDTRWLEVLDRTIERWAD